MPLTINVNRRSLVHRSSGGVSSATLPDVCLVPGAGPIPFPNTAFSKDLEGGTRDVVADGGSSIAVRGSSFAVSHGGEPGTLGGVISGVNGSESTWLSYSLDVKIEGRNACRLGDKMLHNRGNTINCAGVVQPTLKDGGTVVVIGSKDDEHHGKYSLQVDVKLQLPAPPPKSKDDVPKEPPPKPLADTRVRITAKDGTTWEGDTTPGKGKKSKGRVKFERLARSGYTVDVFHDCYSADPANDEDVFVNANPRKHEMKMRARKLLDAATERGFRLGARSEVTLLPVYDGKDAVEPETLRQEFGDLIYATFLGSRSGDETTNGFGQKNRDLQLLTGTTKVVVNGVETEIAAIETLGVDHGRLLPISHLASQQKMGLQVTPLVWPAPLVTPGWPAGHPDSQVSEPGYIAPDNSYVARRAAAEQKGDLAAKRGYAMEVHEAFIRRIVRAFESGLIPGTAEPVTWGSKPAFVVCNEVLNMRYHDQENATKDKDYARSHPFWQLFGMWDVDESNANLKSGFEAPIRDLTLWYNIERCFQIAHEEAPEALLILNDYGIEGLPSSLDYRGLHRAREDAFKAAGKRRDREIFGAPFERKGKLIKTPLTSLEEANDRAKKARDDSRDERPWPKSIDDVTRKYLEALKIAERTFDNEMDEVARHHDAELRRINAEAKGFARNKASRKKAVHAQEALFDADRSKHEAAYQAALAAAETAYKAGYVKVPPGVFPPGYKPPPPPEPGAAPVPPAPPPPGAPPAKAEAAKGQMLKVAKARHEAGRKFEEARKKNEKAFSTRSQKVWERYQKEYLKPHRDASEAYSRAEKPQLFYRLVRWLLSRKQPWTKKLVVGFQMHFPANPERKLYRPRDIERCVRRYAKLGLPIYVTELDVTTNKLDTGDKASTKVSLLKKSDTLAKPKIDQLKKTFPLPLGPGETEKQGQRRQEALVLTLQNRLAHGYYVKHRPAFAQAFREQAELTYGMMKALLSRRNCVAIHTWGVADYRSAFRQFGYWFQPSFECSIKGCQSTHPPGEYDRKPSYHAAVSAVLASPKQLPEAAIRALAGTAEKK